MRRLAILSTHPIQYNAPLFRMLHEHDGIDLQVFFSKTWEQVKFDPDFQREVIWDTPVSEGYPHATQNASYKTGKTSLAIAIRDFAPHALLIYGWNFPGHLTLMRTFHGSIPIWFRGDSHLLDPMPTWKKALRRLWLSWVYRHIDLAFTVGSANEAYFAWSGLQPNQMARAPHAVDNAFFERDDISRREEALQWRSKLGIETSEPVVLFAGKFEPKKQPDVLLAAWDCCQTERPHIILAGSGAMEKELKAKWEEHPKVHFIGFQNQRNMPVVYRLADLYCLPSAGPGETWGLSVNEALASGTPCAVSDRAGCAQDVIRDKTQGVILSCQDLSAWTSAIKQCKTIKKRNNLLPREFNMSVYRDLIAAELNSNA